VRVWAKTEAVPGSGSSTRGGGSEQGPEQEPEHAPLKASGDMKPDLEQLIRLAKSGDKAAMTNLLTCVYPDLLSYLARLCGERYLAEDLCQETMVRVISGLRRYRLPPGDTRRKFHAWMLTIATNLYRDHLRKSSRLLFVAEASDESTANVEDSALEALRCREVLSALMRIPCDLRVAFVLKTYYGFSYKEVGRIAGCPEGTAKSRVHNAVLSLRDELKRRGLL